MQQVSHRIFKNGPAERMSDESLYFLKIPHCLLTYKRLKSVSGKRTRTFQGKKNLLQIIWLDVACVVGVFVEERARVENIREKFERVEIRRSSSPLCSLRTFPKTAS